MKRRLTSWLLTLAMLLSLMPAMGVTASAANTGSGSGTADDPYVVTTYEELQTAMQKAGGGYVRLGKDIDTTSMNGDMGIGFKGQIVVSSNVALDLCSHKVTLMKRGDTERSGLIDVRRGSLTIEDSKGGGELNGKNMLTSKRLYLIECYDGAKVTVNSGTLTMWSAQTAQTANAVIKNAGTVEINGGTLAISNEKNYDEVNMYLAQQDCALSMTSLDGSSVVINGGTFKGRVLLYAHAKSAGKAGSVINGGTFEKSVYVQKDRTKTGDVPLDVSIRGGTYRYTPGYRTNDEGNQVSDPQDMFQFATKGFLNGDSTYYDETPYPHGADPAEGKLDKYDLTAFRSIFPTNATLVAKGQSYTHRDYRDGSETEVQLVDKLFTGADGNTEWARLMNSEYQTIDVVSDIQLEDATLKVGDTIVPDNGGNVTTGDKAITITGKVSKRIAQLVQAGKIDLGFGLNVVKTTKPMKDLNTTAATLSTASNSDGRLNVTVTLPSAQLVKADYSVRLDLFPKKPGTTTTIVGEGLLPSGWKLSADSANKPVTINYNANGGSGSMASQQVMSGKQPYTLPDCTFTAPAAGQVFKGWSTSQNSTDILTDGKLTLDGAETSVTVYAIWGVPAGTEIDKVTIQVKPKAERENVENDFRPLNSTPASVMTFRMSQVFEELSGTGGDQASVYDATKDYSAIYEFEANGSYSFADGISTADVTINDGQVWKVTRLNDGKNLLVYVNFPAASTAGQVVKTVTIQVKPEADRTQLNDFLCQSYTPAGSMGSPACIVREGLNTDGTGSTPAAYDKTKDYSVIYLFPLNPGCTIAADISADDVTINDGQVYKVESDNDGRTLLVYVNFPAGQVVKTVTIQVKPEAERTTLNDFACQSYTPAGSMGSPFFVVREGLNTDGSGSTLTTYDKNKDYSVVYEFKINSGCTIAADISKADVTINDGHVWQVKSDSTGEHLLVYVNFPAASAAGQVVKTVTIQVKPKDERNALNDFACQSYTPNASMGNPACIVRAGLNTDGTGSYPTAYDKNTDYSVVYEFPINSGCTIAADISTSDVTINDGQVWKVSSDSKGEHLLVYVNFPVTGPTPVTETIEKINLDFKPYSGRKTIGDLNPITQNPGTDKMELAIKYFYEGDTAGPHSLAENEKYESSKNYTASLQYNCKNDVTIAKGFTKEDITISNGTVNQIVRNDKYVIIVVNFPKDPTTDPNYVTEVAVQVAAPVAGEKPSMNGITVTSSNADKIERALVFWKFDISYVAGQEYSPTVYLEPKKGVTFAKNLKLKVNGKDAEFLSADPDGSVQFKTKITAVGPSAPTTYAVNVTSGGNGTVTADHATAAAGTKITLTATADSGYHFKEWKVVKGGVTVKDNKFTMPAENVEVKAIFEKNSSTGGGGGGGGTSSYAITVNSAKNGGVTASHKSASKGTTVTLTVKPDKGYVLDTLTVLDSKDKAIKLTEKSGKFTFTMPAGKVTVESKFKAEQTTGKNPFTDVPAGSYYEDAVIWAVDKGITGGTSATTFSPDATCTRAQIVTFLWRAAGSPAPKAMSTFVDVSADAYYAKAVAWAVENGITGGTGDGKFSPDAACTRAQAVTFLWRANGSPAVSGNAAFSDVAANAYYAAAVTWAEKNGITGGIGNGLFGSDHNCTRAQIVTFLYSSMK